MNVPTPPTDRRPVAGPRVTIPRLAGRRSAGTLLGILFAGILFAGMLVAAPVEAAVTVRTLDEHLEVDGRTLLVVDLGVGTIEVTAGAADRIEVTGKVRCSRFSRRCRRQAEGLTLKLDRRSASVMLRVAHTGSFHLGSPPQVDLTIRMPAGLALEVDLGVGDVEVVHAAAAVDVDLGVGNVEIRLRGETAGTVTLEVGVGVARIEPDRGRVRRDGFLLFGNEIRWQGGGGSADVRVDVGVGSASVTVE